MARPTVLPREQERPFGHDELFYSTTDRRGIITSCNDTFVRISGHARERLIGANHNIIRHPDMPRAVFKLLWDYLAAGKSFAGYVKNMAADGCHYWVVALIVPTQRGYLSVRFKPSSALFPVVKGLYPALLAIEHEAGTADGAWRVGMQRAGEALTAAIREKGFASYDEFMHALLASELLSHRSRCGLARTAAPDAGATGDGELLRMLGDCDDLDGRLSGLFSTVEGYLAIIKDLDRQAAFLLDLSSDIHLVSLNALIGSCRLDNGGEGFSIVTESLAGLSQESHGTIDLMTRQLTALTASLREVALSAMGAKLQVEMTVFFLRELLAESRRDGNGQASRASTRGEIGMLAESFTASTVRLADAVPRARQPLPALMRLQDQLAGDLRRLVIVRLIGKIQAVGLTDESHFRELLDRVLEQVSQASSELESLSGAIGSLRQQLPTLERLATTTRGAVHAFHTLGDGSIGDEADDSLGGGDALAPVVAGVGL